MRILITVIAIFVIGLLCSLVLSGADSVETKWKGSDKY